jgi:cytochrome c-type biogenesis protein CcmE
MKPKQQRLFLGVIAVAAIVGAAFIALAAMKQKASYFYTPSELISSPPAKDAAIRLGGMVVENSLKRSADDLTLNFMVTDQVNQIPVVFKGIPPELFKEKSGVVADGRIGENGQFVADNLLAKHDERYMPPQLKGMKPQEVKVSQ